MDEGAVFFPADEGEGLFVEAGRCAFSPDERPYVADPCGEAGRQGEFALRDGADDGEPSKPAVRPPRVGDAPPRCPPKLAYRGV